MGTESKMTRVLIGKVEFGPKMQTHKESHSKMEAETSGTSVNQGMPRIASKHGKLGERYGQILPWSPEGTNLASTLVSDF